MPLVSIDDYLSRLAEFLSVGNGLDASDLISLKHSHVSNPRLAVERPEAAVSRVFESPLDAMVGCHLKCIFCIQNGSVVDAFNCQRIVLQSVVKLLEAQPDENWSLPLLFVTAVDLRRLAVSTDRIMVKKRHKKRGEMLEAAANLLMNAFRVCQGDSRAPLHLSKKWGMLNIVNQQLKIYFVINKLKLCDALIKAIENCSIKDTFSLAQRVTYKFYVGKKALFEGEYETADQCLGFAFRECHIGSCQNKQLILSYWIPVRMLRGVSPSSFLLKKYKLNDFFGPVTAAVRSGNLMALSEALEERNSKQFFIGKGIYLLLEKLKFLTCRTLFKKVYLMAGTHMLPISLFTSALRFTQPNDPDIDDDETQCILANLICEGKIKGYLSETHRKLVVSKNNAFPQLSLTN